MSINLMEMDLIGCIEFKSKHIDVYRDKWGKYFVRVDGTITQKKLTSKEIVSYLLNAMNDK